MLLVPNAVNAQTSYNPPSASQINILSGIVLGCVSAPTGCGLSGIVTVRDVVSAFKIQLASGTIPSALQPYVDGGNTVPYAPGGPTRGKLDSDITAYFNAWLANNPGGGGGGGGGTTPTDAEKTEWKTCVDAAFTAYSLASTAVADNDINAAIKTLSDSITANDTAEIAKFMNAYQGCNSKAYVTKSGLSTTNEASILGAYRNVTAELGGGGGGGSGGSGGGGGGTTPTKSCFDITWGSVLTVLGTGGLAFMMCQMEVLWRILLSQILSWLGVPAGSPSDLTIGGGGGVDVDTGTP